MSGIDEYILGACFIERKAKALPWDISSKEDIGANESDEKMVIQDIEDEPQDAPDQGIISQSRAEDILAKITLGNLKFGDINFTSTRPKRPSEGPCEGERIIDCGFEKPKTPAYITNTVAMQTTINEAQKFGCLKDEQVDVQILKPDANISNVSPCGTDFESLYLPSFINRRNACIQNMAMQFPMTETNGDYPRDINVLKLSNKNSESNLSMTKPRIYPSNVNIFKLESCRGDNVEDSWDSDGFGFKELKSERQDKKLQRMDKKETFISGLEHEIRDPFDCANDTNKISLSKKGIDTAQRKSQDHRKSIKSMNVQATDLCRTNRKRKIKGKETKFTTDVSLKSEIKQASSIPSVNKINDLVVPGQELYGSSSLKYKKSGKFGESKVVNEKEENVNTDSADYSSKRNKVKTIQNTRKCKTKSEKTEIQNEHREDDVFDITPAKDTPWSPSQDDTEENAKKAHPGTNGSNDVKKTKRLHADNIKTECSIESKNIIESRGSRHVTLTGIASGISGEHGNIDTICVSPANTRKGRYNQDMKIINVETIELFINHYDDLQNRAKHPYNRPLLAPEKRAISKNKNLCRNANLNHKKGVLNPVKNELKRGTKRMKNKIGHDRIGITKKSVLMNEGSERSKENTLSGNIIDPLKYDIKRAKMKRRDTGKDKIPVNSLKVRTNISNVVNEYPDIPNRKFGGTRNSSLQKIKVKQIGEEKGESLDANIHSTAILANTKLSPIVEEHVEFVNKETLISTIGGISPKQESTVQDEVLDVEIHDDSKCEIQKSVENNSKVTALRDGKIRRLLNWFSCCFRPKVDD